MQNTINFFKQLIYLLALCKLLSITFNLCFFHKLRVTKHRILIHLFTCINKQMHLWLVKMERRLDSKLSTVEPKSNVVPLTNRKK
jgi:hypothetical protein